jgi:Uma2 family endonuclease
LIQAAAVKAAAAFCLGSVNRCGKFREMDAALLDSLVNAPDFFQQLEKLNERAQAERELRRKFYETITEQEKVEFINGEVVFQSPAKLRHVQASDNLFELLSVHVKLNDLGIVRHEKLLISLSRNDFEPDISFFTKGRAEEFKPDQMQFPAPDFVVEVLSGSTEARDRGIKMTDYAAHGVREYWIVDPKLEQVEVFLPTEGRFRAVALYGSGEIESAVISGFRIRVRGIFDAQTNLLELRRLMTPEG